MPHASVTQFDTYRHMSVGQNVRSSRGHDSARFAFEGVLSLLQVLAQFQKITTSLLRA